MKLFSHLGCKTGWTANLAHELEEFLAKFWRFLHVIWEAKITFQFKNYAKKGKVSCYLLRVSLYEGQMGIIKVRVL